MYFVLTDVQRAQHVHKNWANQYWNFETIFIIDF